MDMYFKLKFIEDIIGWIIIILCFGTCTGIILWAWIKQKIKEWRWTRDDEKNG